MNKIEKSINIVAYSLIIIALNIMRVIKLPSGTPFNIALSDFVVPVIGVLLLLSIRHYKFSEVFVHYYMMILLLGWITLTSVLAIESIDINDQLFTGYISELLKTIICIIYFYVGYNTLRYLKKKHFCRLWMVGGYIFLSYGFIASYLASKNMLPEIMKGNHRSYFLGTYTDPNHAAIYITITFYLMLIGIKYDKSKIAQFSYGVIAFISTIALLLTDSRGGLIGFNISLFVFLFLIGLQKKQLLLSGLLTLAITVMIGLNLDAILFKGRYIGKIVNSFKNFSSGFQIRFDLANAARLMGNDHPLFGVGRGNYILNSAKYFEIMGAKFRDNIPHNTYLGLYAEVGIIGTILYFIPLILILIYFYKQYKSSKTWVKSNRYFYYAIIASIIGVGIQALVLNVENRRSIWFIAGIVLYIIKYKLIDTQDKKETSKKYRMIIVNGILSIVLIGTYVFGMFNAYFVEIRMKLEEDYSRRLIIRNEDVGKALSLEYNIYTIQKDFTQDTVEVKIVEKYEDGQEKVRDTYTYKQASGNVIRSFVKEDKESDIYIEATKLSDELIQYYFLPKKVVADHYVNYLNRNYYLSPKFNDYLIESIEWKDYKGEDYEQILKDEININFDNKIILEKVDIDEKDGKKYLKFNFYYKEQLDGEYVFWLYGYPDNILNLNENRLQSGMEGYGPMDSNKTTDWQVGNKYTITYEFPRNVGWYNLRCGFYTKKEDKVVRLYPNKQSSHVADLKWFDAK